MVTFASSFSAGGGSQTFSARVQGHSEDVRSIVTLHVVGVFANVSAWGNMATLRTWKYSVREIPGAETIAAGVVIQILGGKGFGSLVVDSYSSWTALLADMTLDQVSPRSGLVFGRLTFVMQPS